MSQKASKRPSIETTAAESGHSAENGKAAYKRRRIALACTSCRNRKSRCNGTKPSCSLCTQLGFECIYEQPANPQSQSAARSHDGYEARLSSIEETLRLLVSQQNVSPGLQSKVAESARGSTVATPPRPIASDVATLVDDDICLPDASDDTVDGMATIGESSEQNIKFFGPSSNIALLGEISRMLSAALRSRGQHQRSLGHSSEEHLVSQMPSPQASAFAPTPATLANSSPCTLPSEAHATTMIERFFADTGMLFPFISKEYITTSYQTARAADYRGVRRSWLCLLNMIFAFATFTHSSGGQSMEKNIVESKVYFNRAQDLLAESKLRLADLEVVQCLLLMSQYRQGTHRSDETWSLHGLAIHAATQIGLHCANSMSSISKVEVEMRKRVWFGCVLLDSTLSMTLGRPLSIPREYVTLDLPQSISIDNIQKSATSGADVPTNTNTLCFFTSTILLYRIQNDIISRLYNGNLSADTSIDLNFLTVEISRIEHNLVAWQHNLAPELKLTPWAVATTVTGSTSDLVFERLSVIIRLRFLHAKLLLHRTTIHTLYQRLVNSQVGQNDDSKSFSGCLAQQSLVLCMRSAIEIVDIVCKMSKIPSRLGSWWFTIYYTFHALLVLVKCLIYHFEFSSTDKELPCPIYGNDEVAEAALSLLKGKDAVERVGQGTRSSKRICRTLLKMIKICTSIAYSSSVDASPVQLLLNYLESTGQFHDSRAVEMSNMNLGIPGFEGRDMREQPERLEAEFSEFWMQSDLDIFAGLGGLEVGLSGLIAS